MKLICTVLLFGTAFLFRLCSKDDTPPPQGNFFIQTVDGFGNPVKSTIIYEFQDCEYDYSSPDTVKSNKHGLTGITVPEGEYIQFHALGFVYQSYHCFNSHNRPDTIVVFAAPIPTYVFTTPHAVVNWFPNTSGNCNYQNITGTQVTADANGKAILFLPPAETYKIQVGTSTQCYQPEQTIDTLYFAH